MNTETGKNAESGSNTATRLNTETATLAGGCFWCLEAVFLRFAGVESVVSGYMGGPLPHPSYTEVCKGTTGHAEVVQIHFDPARMPFATLLDIFFTIHDPTTLNRQGHDEGTQYRSAIFCHSEAQTRAARHKVAALSAEEVFANPVVTEITPATVFYPAEAYHQNYFARNPNQGYCQAVVAPKVRKAFSAFGPLLKA